MRIACVHIPQFALQCVTRLDPSLRRAAVVVVGSGLDPGAGTVARVALHSPIVHACSRAAWAHGVRIGMTATAARSLSPDLVIVSADSVVERETVRAIADVLLGTATTVDIGGRVGPGGAHLALYTDVPVKTRGQSFGEKLVELLDELGLAARIGIADDRFTAWVAASSPTHAPAPSVTNHADTWDAGVVSVPRGGSAAFLAPRPLSLLAISPEVQHMLEALGVRSLGEFAALPAPSVARPQVAAAGADFQALARGESGSLLRPYLPEASIREEVVTSDALGGVTALAMLGSRLALRLAGRDRLAARLEITITASGAPPRTIGQTLEDTTASATELAEIIGLAIGDLERGTRLRIVVAGEALPGAVATTAVAEGSAPIEMLPTVLSVVLANTGTGSATWSLTSPEPTMHTERREAHRRMRRGKQRRHAVPAQSRLWKVE
jgi:hypothetical protein